MAVQERRVPTLLSYGAIVAAMLVCAWLFEAGRDQPRQYTVNMSVNHHRGYGISLACHQCHVGTESGLGFGGGMTCATAECHGDLAPETPDDERLEKAVHNFPGHPEPEERARLHLANHTRFARETCWSCHHEHRIGEPNRPEEWMSLEQLAEQWNADSGE